MRLRFIQDYAEWQEVFDGIPPHLQDVHYSYSYAKIQKIDRGGEVVLAVAEFNDGKILQVFHRLFIPESKFTDLTNVYGFGGPLGIGNVGTEQYTEFAAAVAELCKSNFTISEYCCLHPLLNRNIMPLLSNVEISVNKYTVVIENLPVFDLKCTARRVRRGVKAAIENGIEIVEDENPAAFASLYLKSMDLLQAHERWRKPYEYWSAHSKSVGARWFFAKDESGYHRGLLTVGIGKTAYAHFLGNDGERRNDGLDDLLYYTAALRLRDSGVLRFHLGGGTTSEPNDPLFLFKSSFSSARYQVASYTRIFDHIAYADLLAATAAKEIATLGRLSAVKAWFPQYRRPAV